MEKTAWGKLYGENCMGKTTMGINVYGERDSMEKSVWGQVHGENCMGKMTQGETVTHS